MNSIQTAYDKISGKLFQADEIFTSAIESNKFRTRYNQGEFELECPSCFQQLGVSKSKNEKGFFHHFANSEECELKSSNLTKKESKNYSKIFHLKESPRHVQLKNRIGKTIAKIEGVKDIRIDDFYVIKDEKRKKPDVYCEYNGKKLVFEIQLSVLPLRYIIDRYDFYSKNRMYLIWILDNCDITTQSTMEKDLKYSCTHQNYFTLDESETDFRLICQFKKTYFDDYHVRSKWTKRSIKLSELSFDEERLEIFYYNYQHQKKRAEKKLAAFQKEQKILERNREIEESKEFVNYFISDLKKAWKNKDKDFKQFDRSLFEFDEDDIKHLNLGLNHDKKLLYNLFEKAYPDHFHFIKYVLEISELNIFIGESISNQSYIEALYNSKVSNKSQITLSLVKRGYKLTQNDFNLIKSNLEEYDNGSKERELLILTICDKFIGNRDIHDLFKYSSIICCFESLKENRIIGFNYISNSWVQFANNAITSYGKHWDLIFKAMKYYNRLDYIYSLDKKQSFKKKIVNFYSSKLERDYTLNRILRTIYPEVGI